MCLLIVLALAGPRLAIITWWLLAMSRWEAAFDNFLWPFLGFIFVPWTTLMYVLVAPSGNVNGIDWMWLGLALVADIAMYGGSGYGGRGRYQSR